MTAPEMSMPICECAAFWESHHPDCPVRRRIEALQRENEELKAELAAKILISPDVSEGIVKILEDTGDD